MIFHELEPQERDHVHSAVWRLRYDPAESTITIDFSGRKLRESDHTSRQFSDKWPIYSLAGEEALFRDIEKGVKARLSPLLHNGQVSLTFDSNPKAPKAIIKLLKPQENSPWVELDYLSTRYLKTDPVPYPCLIPNKAIIDLVQKVSPNLLGGGGVALDPENAAPTLSRVQAAGQSGENGWRNKPSITSKTTGNGSLPSL